MNISGAGRIEGLEYALENYTFRSNAAKFVILVTDTYREVTPPRTTETFASLFAQLSAAGVTMETIVNVTLQDGGGSNALAVDVNGVAYLPDGLGGYTTSPGGTVTPGPGFGGNNATIITDFVNLGFATGGITGDLNQIAVGGFTTASFPRS